MRTTFKTNASGRGDRFPVFGQSGYRDGDRVAPGASLCRRTFRLVMPEGSTRRYPRQCPVGRPVGNSRDAPIVGAAVQRASWLRKPRSHRPDSRGSDHESRCVGPASSCRRYPGFWARRSRRRRTVDATREHAIGEPAARGRPRAGVVPRLRSGQTACVENGEFERRLAPQHHLDPLESSREIIQNRASRSRQFA
jgi:hypothetical protein